MAEASQANVALCAKWPSTAGQTLPDRVRSRPNRKEKAMTVAENSARTIPRPPSEWEKGVSRMYMRCQTTHTTPMAR